MATVAARASCASKRLSILSIDRFDIDNRVTRVT